MNLNDRATFLALNEKICKRAKEFLEKEYDQHDLDCSIDQIMDWEIRFYVLDEVTENCDCPYCDGGQLESHEEITWEELMDD